MQLIKLKNLKHAVSSAVEKLRRQLETIKSKRASKTR